MDKVQATGSNVPGLAFGGSECNARRAANGGDELGFGTRRVFVRPAMRTWIKFK
jgi:hypothetical protein